MIDAETLPRELWASVVAATFPWEQERESVRNALRLVNRSFNALVTSFGRPYLVCNAAKPGFGAGKVALREARSVTIRGTHARGLSTQDEEWEYHANDLSAILAALEALSESASLRELAIEAVTVSQDQTWIVTDILFAICSLPALSNLLKLELALGDKVDFFSLLQVLHICRRLRYLHIGGVIQPTFGHAAPHCYDNLRTPRFRLDHLRVPFDSIDCERSVSARLVDWALQTARRGALLIYPTIWPSALLNTIPALHHAEAQSINIWAPACPVRWGALRHLRSFSCIEWRATGSTPVTIAMQAMPELSVLRLGTRLPGAPDEQATLPLLVDGLLTIGRELQLEMFTGQDWPAQARMELEAANARASGNVKIRWMEAADDPEWYRACEVIEEGREPLRAPRQQQEPPV